MTALLAAAMLAAPSWAAKNPCRQARLKTDDGWQLTARYCAAKSSSAVVMLHGLAAGKGEWEPLAQALNARGVATLAIDLRGHGLLATGKKSWQRFSDHGPKGQWASMWKDAQAGIRFLNEQGYTGVGVVGASLGANVALDAAVHEKSIRAVVLLSPGLDYQGVRAGDNVIALGPRPLLLGVSAPDQYAYQSCELLRGMRAAAKLPVESIEAAQGHGAQMLAQPEVLKGIADWIAAHFK